MSRGLEPAREAFRRRWPTFDDTSVLDELRAADYRRLDAKGQVYLDYTGASLYPESQVRAHAAQLCGEVLGNPHSSNPSAARATELSERCRARVLQFFRASPDEYCVIFTANTTHALKLVGESYPFAPGGRFALTFDNHNSVNGIREFARAHGAEVTYVPVLPPDLRADEAMLARVLDEGGAGAARLFAYPAQSNFSGVQHPLEWIDRARTGGWDVLLDAAAFVPTNPLDLSVWRPDFVTCSFYKMFGYPTGIGALVARREALGRLHRPWFAGGTITVASVTADRYYLAPGEAGFEDGTINYTSLPAVELGLDLLDGVGMPLIHERVRCLTAWLLEELTALRHATGRPLLRIYGPLGADRRGGTMSMNFHDPDGHFVDHQVIEDLAGARGICLRSGCFCNPGAGELALGLSAEELSTCFRRTPERMTMTDFRRCIDDKSTGAVRVSLGLATTFEDVHALVQFARELLDRRTAG